jgi:hypothetical protein
MPYPTDNDSDERAAARTMSANTGNIRYGTRGMDYNPYRGEGSAREVIYPWRRNLQNQGRTIRQIWRQTGRNGSR